MAYPDPEYRRWVAATWKAALEKAKREGSAFQPFEVNVRCKDGLVKTVLVNASAFDDGPDGVHLVVLYDITARKRVEEELQSTHVRLREQASLLDQARDAILVRDLDHRITFWNKGAERLYGWTDSEAIGRNAIELLYADATTFHSAWERTLSAGEWIGEMRQIDRNGRPVICEGRWTLVPDAAGRPASVLCIHTDITERRKLEQQFLRAQRLESIGTLAGGIAHDLNNVLAPVILAADLLKMTVTDPEDRDLIATIATSAQRGANMVSQVLSFARGLEGVRVELQVRHLMDDIEKIARDTLPKNIEVRTAVAPDLKTVLGDPNQLHQVLLNLCVNARDAMPNGGEVTLTASNVDLDSAAAAMHIEASAGPYVSIEVRDTGTGMPPSVLERIFDPFFTTKDVGKGTGLGLSTSLAIVKSHGGFVRVSSEEGQGSVFAVYLPAGAGAGAADRVNEPAAPPRGHGETVLVVDDEIAIRLMVRQTLETFGYRVVLACDGAEALTLYERHRSDIAVVLTDMMMPVMDGPTAIQALMRMDPDVHIIAASGLSAAGGPEMPAVPGARHFLPKPYSAHSLLTIIERALLKE